MKKLLLIAMLIAPLAYAGMVPFPSGNGYYNDQTCYNGEIWHVSVEEGCDSTYKDYKIQTCGCDEYCTMESITWEGKDGWYGDGICKPLICGTNLISGSFYYNPSCPNFGYDPLKCTSDEECKGVYPSDGVWDCQCIQTATGKQCSRMPFENDGTCVTKAWMPVESVMCKDQNFVQTSNCGEKRTTIGTQTCETKGFECDIVCGAVCGACKSGEKCVNGKCVDKDTLPPSNGGLNLDFLTDKSIINSIPNWMLIGGALTLLVLLKRK